MKLSKETIAVLKNFSNINPGITFRKGNTQKTISVGGNIYASANIPDVVEQDFSIYSIPEFLATVSLFNEPELTLHDSFFTIEEGNAKVKYGYVDSSLVKAPPAKGIKFPETKIEFSLTKEQFSKIQESARVLNLDYLYITEKGLIVRSLNRNDNSDSNQYSVKVDFKTELKTFTYVIKIEYMKMLSYGYNVSVCENLVIFNAQDTDDSNIKELCYVIANETI